MPFSAVEGSGSKIYYVPQESKDHEVAVDPVKARIEIEPVPDSVKVQKEPERFTIGGYDLSLSIEADTLEWGEKTTVDVDPLYPDGDTVRVGQVAGNVFLHELLWRGFRKEAAPSKSKLRKEADEDDDPEGTSAPREFGVLDCPDRTPSARVVLPDTSGSDLFDDLKVGCDEYERFLMLNLPQATASRDTIRLVTDSTTLRPKLGEQVQVTVQARSFFDGIYGAGAGDYVIVVPSQPDTVLLGETRYYQAVEKNNKLEMEALDDPSNASSKRVKDVSWTVSKMSGDRLGVYYDTEYYDQVNITQVAQDNIQAKPGGPHELPSGFIRITGRFWTPETTYKVSLSASGNGKTGGTQVVVKRPDRLGDGPLRDYASYQLPRIVENVYGEEFNIDSLIITYAGRYGIPPQFIKGQARLESVGFEPSYRYEPLTTQFQVDETQESWVRDWTENPFFVTETAMGTGQSVPNDHENVHFEVYPKTPKTVWDFLTSHSDLDGRVNRNPKYVELEDNTLDFGPYETAGNVYGNFVRYFKGDDKTMSEQEKQLALDSTTVYLREQWSGPKDYESSTEGLENMIAQTRTGSSYGPLQIVYKRAINSSKTPDPYPVTNADTPERLNLYDVVFPLNMRSQIRELKNILGVKKEDKLPERNWRNGNVKTYEKALFEMYHEWNPGKNYYEQNVFGFSQDFLPIEKESSQ